jgi:hypothetical protein
MLVGFSTSSSTCWEGLEGDGSLVDIFKSRWQLCQVISSKDLAATGRGSSRQVRGYWKVRRKVGDVCICDC